MKLSWLLLARVIAGGIGFFPPLAAAISLDRLQYGLGASLFALALLVLGPVAQYVSQGYMRALLLPERPQVAAAHILVVFTALVASVLAVLCATGALAVLHGAVFLFAVVALMLSRLEEVRQIANERQMHAVMLFYVAPPFIITLAFLLSAQTGMAMPWPMVTITMACGYLLPALLSCVLRGGRLRMGKIRPGTRDLAVLWSESRTFLVAGMVSSATENVPTLALTMLGIPERVATFEVMRKLASAISVFLHGLAIAFAPRIITAAARGDMPAVVATIRQNAKLSLLFAGIYLPAAILGVFVLRALGWEALFIPAGMAIPLFLSSFVTCLAAPFGMAVAAFHMERWWVIGGATGFSAFAVTLLLAGILGGMQTVAIGILLQNIALSATITMVVCRKIRRSGFDTASNGTIGSSGSRHDATDGPRH